MVAELNDDNFAAEVLEASEPVLVDFWAPWCGPCRQLAPVVEELAAENDGSVKVTKLNVDEASQTAQQYALALNQLFVTGQALEKDLQTKQVSLQTDGKKTPASLLYVITAVSALNSGLSTLADFYQQVQSPMATPSDLQNQLRIVQLNNTIYWLAITLYYDGY